MTKLFVLAQIKAQNFFADRKGVTALEYGLIASLIGVVIITTVTALGGKINTVFATISNALITTPRP
jgi:pilus assembly protein Flp/PilA